MKDPETKVGANSTKEYTRLLIAADNGTEGGSVLWNATMFADLKALLPKELFKKFRYAKFMGVAQERPWTDKDGNKRISNDLLVRSVELQDGTLVRVEKEKDENADEDAPF